MPSLVEFLKHVLPNEGYYCWWFKNNKIPQQGFTSTVEQLADVLQRIDAAGFDAFFACSTFKTPTNRKGENVHSTRSFWLDIDAGPGKPYRDAEAALDALDAFCDQAQLHYPTVVYSGGGIHCYWRNEKNIEPAPWLERARAFKSIVEQRGLLADPARTTDVASILRPPGTHNYKIPNTPRPVECDELLEGSLFGTERAVAGHEKNLADASKFTQETDQISNFNMGALGGSSKPDMLKGYPDGFRTNELTLRIGWLLGPEKKTEDETIAACLAWNAYNTPPLDQEKIIKTVRSIAKKERAKQQEVAKVLETFPPLLKGYELDQFYQLMTTIQTEDANGKPTTKKVVVNRWPIYLAEVRDGETERNQGLLFRQWEPDRGWYEIEVPVRDYEGTSKWGILGYHGINIADASRTYFKQYVHRWWSVLSGAKKLRYDQFGWKNNYTEFYLGDTLYKADGTKERHAASRDAALRGNKMVTAKSGSLVGWSAAANKFFKSGCEAISFALLSGGFSSPLMPLITPEGEGGAVLSLLSPGSGTGKSTVLTGIASVWGDLEALRLTMRDTENSRFRVIATLCNLPVICDELRDVDPEVPTKMIAAFTVGRDKLRARTDGTVNPVVLAWKLLFISASNKSLVDALQKHGDDPLSARVFEIETTPPKDVVYSFTNQLSNELIMNQGFAGRAYINYLMQPGVLDWAKRNLYILTEKYGQHLGARPPHRFIVRQLGAAAVSMHIVKKMGILEFNEERIMQWALEEASRAIKGIIEFDPVTTLAGIINQYSSTDMVVVEHGFHPKRIEPTIRRPTRGVHMRRELGTGKLFISSEFIKNELIKRGQSWMATARILEQKDILLERSRQISLGAGTADVITAKTACWLIDMTNPLIGELVVKEVLPFAAKTG